MDVGTITDREVRRALSCIRSARTLEGCVLLDMAAIRHRLAMEGMPPSAESLEWALEGLLHETVSARLADLRHAGGQQHASASALPPQDRLASDFQAGSIDLEAWSGLYYRFLCPGLQQKAYELAAIALPDRQNRSGERLFQRRLQRAVHSLASELRDIEHEAGQHSPAAAASAGDARIAASRVTSSDTPFDIPLDTPSNLPAQVTSFVGRESELEALAALLEQPDARLITLVGPGGAGKTRLALEAASRCNGAYPDGVFLVSVASATSRDEVVLAAADVLEIPPSASDSTENLLQHLAGRRMLLILDECEHALGQAEVLTEILQGTRDLRLLATSRERLGLLAERLVAVDGLPYAAASEGGHSSLTGAVRLFVERSTAVRPGFAVNDATTSSVLAICRLVEGMPLAIELAASLVADVDLQSIEHRLRTSPETLATEFRDIPRRHRSLRAVFDQSWSSLSPDEQAALARLTVFRGGFTLDAAEKVADASAGPVAVLATKSLLRRTADGRIAIHRMLRGFAREKRVSQSDIEARHAAYYVALAERAEPHLSGRNVSVWLKRLTAERGNLRAAFEWLREADRPDDCLRLASSLARYWELTGRFTSGLGQIEACLARTSQDDRTPARANALNAAGSLAEELGDFAGAQGYFEESLAIRRGIGDERGIAESLSNLGNVADFRADYRAAHAYHEEALAVRRRIRDRRGIAISLNNLGNVATFRGDYVAAQQMYEESLVLFRAIGDRWAVSVALNNVGRVAMELGDHRAARNALRRSMAIARELDDRQGVAYALHNLGEVDLSKGRLGPAEKLLAESLRESAAIENSQGVAAALEWLAQVARERGDAVRAVRLLASADALRARIGAPVAENERDRVEDALKKLRLAIGDDAFELAWQSGQLMTEEEATAYALRLDSE